MLYCYWCIRSHLTSIWVFLFMSYGLRSFFLFCNNSKSRQFLSDKKKKRNCSQSVQDTHMACERHRRRIKNVKLSSMLLRFHLWDKTCRSRHHQTLPEHPSLIRFYSTIFFHHFWDLVSLFLKSCHFSSKHIVFSSLHISLVLANVIFSLWIFHQSSCVSSILHYCSK